MRNSSTAGRSSNTIGAPARAACVFALMLAWTAPAWAQSVVDKLPDMGGTRSPKTEGFDTRSINTPPFELTGDVTDLGCVRPRSVHTRSFKLTNTGDKDITIMRASSGCACTVPSLRGQVVKPGQTVDIEVKYTAEIDLGLVNQEIKVVCEGWKFPYVITLTAEIGHAVRFNPDGLKAVNTLAGEIILASEGGKPFSVTAINGQAPRFKDFDPVTQPPAASYTVVYNWQGLPPAELPRWMVIETDLPGAELFEVRVIAPEVKSLFDKSAPWSVNVTRQAFVRLEAGTPHEFEVTLQGASLKPNGTVGVESSNTSVRAEVVNARPGKTRSEVIATVHLTPEREGYFSSMLTFSMVGLRAPMDVMGRAVGSEEFSRWKEAQPEPAEQGEAIEAVQPATEADGESKVESGTEAVKP